MEDSSEDEYDLSDIKENLLYTLLEIKSSGSFMTMKLQHIVANPGLHIPRVRIIGLPISTKNAKAMIQSSRMSPYGKGPRPW
jgi:hypothetical protein